MMRSPLTILVGPTCGGKSTLLKSMVEDLGYTPFISHTNRPPREGEVDGRDYNFISRGHFMHIRERLICTRHFRVKSGDVYSYGVDPISLKLMLQEHSQRGVVMILDYEGAQEIKGYIQTPYSVILVTAPETELISRAMRRGDRADETLDRILRERHIFERIVEEREVDLVVSTVTPEIEIGSKKIPPREFYSPDYHRAD